MKTLKMMAIAAGLAMASAAPLGAEEGYFDSGGVNIA